MMSDEDGLQSEAGEIQKTASALQQITQSDPETGNAVASLLAMGSQTVGSPIHDKVNEEHISSAIQLAEKQDERKYEIAKEHLRIRSSDRGYILVVFVLAVFLFAFILWLFRDKPDVLIPIVSGIGGLVTGALGGFGYGKSRAGV